MDSTSAHTDKCDLQTWLFEAPKNPDYLSVDALKLSFEKTVSAYPFWAGQLYWNEYDPTRGHQHRYGRLGLRYGGSRESVRKESPGIGLTLASYSAPLSSLVPSTGSLLECWNIDEQLPSVELMPAGEVAFQDAVTCDGLPNLRVQITRFSCGGVAVAVKFTHSLADATAMMKFMHDWSQVNRAMVDHEPLPVLNPVFDPLLVDAKAAGNIDAASPDRAILETSRKLPLHRYDWLNSSGGDCPPWFEPVTMIPAEIDTGAEHSLARGDRMPWNEWNMMQPVRHSIFHFTGDEVRRIWTAATASGSSRGNSISKLDALLAHVWAGVMRANELSDADQPYLDVTFGLRSRLNLPSDLIGSPLRQAAVPGNVSADLSTLASRIRHTLSQLDEPEACPALLHDLAFDTTGQNIWATFLGKKHLLCTSWTRLGVYEIDFGGKVAPVYVDAFMPSSDGLMQVMESRPAQDGDHEEEWYASGANVSLHLEAKVMARLCTDRLLRQYA